MDDRDTELSEDERQSIELQRGSIPRATGAKTGALTPAGTRGAPERSGPADDQGRGATDAPWAVVRDQISREPKRPATGEPRGRSGARLPDDERQRTRDAPTAGEWIGTPTGDID